MGVVMVEALVGLVIGYLFGSFPTGYFAGKLYGVDVRRHGSGRTGGTNVLRSAGWGAFAMTVIGDVLKGVLPVLVMRVALPSEEIAPTFAVIGALLGHNWSVFIALLARARGNMPGPSNAYQSLKEFFAKAKGGAGVATTGGAVLTLYWPPTILPIIVSLALLAIFRYASLGSIAGALLYPLTMAYFVLFQQAPPIYLFMSIIAAAIVLYVHIPNMKRLREGTEQKFGQRLGTR